MTKPTGWPALRSLLARETPALTDNPQSTDHTCPKCKSDHLSQSWHDWDSYEPQHYGFGGHEHMHFYCNHCGYDWVENID